MKLLPKKIILNKLLSINTSTSELDRFSVRNLAVPVIIFVYKILSLPEIYRKYHVDIN